MSRIYFHSLHGTEEVRGWERAWAGGLCSELLITALHINRHMRADDPILRLLPKDACVLGVHESRLADTLQTWISAGFDSYFVLPDGKTVDVFAASLNTVLVMGSDPVKLMARLHAQCEIHTYVEGPDRAWLAGIIERGRQVGIMRAESGWEDVASLLRSRDDEPVVTSYSVTEQFPHPYYLADYPPYSEETAEEHGQWMEQWYVLPEEDKWERAMHALRQERGLELKPYDWNTFYFRDGINGFHLREIANKLAKGEQL